MIMQEEHPIRMANRVKVGKRQCVVFIEFWPSECGRFLRLIEDVKIKQSEYEDEGDEEFAGFITFDFAPEIAKAFEYGEHAELANLISTTDGWHRIPRAIKPDLVADSVGTEMHVTEDGVYWQFVYRGRLLQTDVLDEHTIDGFVIDDIINSPPPVQPAVVAAATADHTPIRVYSYRVQFPASIDMTIIARDEASCLAKCRKVIRTKLNGLSKVALDGSDDPGDWLGDFDYSTVRAEVPISDDEIMIIESDELSPEEMVGFDDEAAAAAGITRESVTLTVPAASSDAADNALDAYLDAEQAVARLDRGQLLDLRSLIEGLLS